MKNSVKDDILWYLRTLGFTFLFAMLLCELLFVYLYAGGFSRFPENWIVVLCIIVLFSAIGAMLGERFDDNLKYYIPFTSTMSILLLFSILFWRLDIIDLIFFAFGSMFPSAGLSFLVAGLLATLKTKKLGKKYALFTLVSLTAIGVAVYLVNNYYVFMVSLFDEHPWLATFIGTVVGSVVSLLGGYVIGRHKET